MRIKIAVDGVDRRVGARALAALRNRIAARVQAAAVARRLRRAQQDAIRNDRSKP